MPKKSKSGYLGRSEHPGSSYSGSSYSGNPERRSHADEPSKPDSPVYDYVPDSGANYKQRTDDNGQAHREYGGRQ